jgi:hypothetical protein
MNPIQIHTQFIVRGEIIKIIQSDDEYSQKQSKKGARIHIVPLGSLLHRYFLKESIQEISRLLLEVPKDELKISLEQRKKEYDFILEHGDQNDIDQEFDEFIEETSETVIHCTAETFGTLRKLKIISLPVRSSKPILRQYFINDVLYRQNEELKVEWVELFYDLIYVGAFQKAGKQIMKSYDWHHFHLFVLLCIPILFRWRGQTIISNTIHHHGMFRALVELLIVALVVAMTISLENSFSVDPNINTSNIFLIMHILSAFVIEVYLMIASVFSFGAFFPGLLFKSTLSHIAYIPYIILMFIPLDGTYRKLNIRIALWTVGVCLEIIASASHIAAFKLLNIKKRIAYSIVI